MRKFSEDIMSRCRQRIGLEEDDTSKDDIIGSWDNRTIIDNCLKWEGVIGYTDFILDLIQELYFES